jgi:protein arginine kinase activator
MLCDLCKKNVAKIHLTQMDKGETKKVDLCEECAKAKGIDDPTNFSMADILLGLGAAQEMDQVSPGQALRCPSCGYTQAEFKKTGRLGCAECYATFGEGFESLLKTMHKGTRHSGKVPQALQVSRDVEDQLRGLQRRLDKAVAQEDFEQAAVVRDEIKRLRETARGGEPA